MPSLAEQPACTLREEGSIGVWWGRVGWFWRQLIFPGDVHLGDCDSPSSFITPTVPHLGLFIWKWLGIEHLWGGLVSGHFYILGAFPDVCHGQQYGKCFLNERINEWGKGSPYSPPGIHSVFSPSPLEAETADRAELLAWGKGTPRGCGYKNVCMLLFTLVKWWLPIA